MSAPYAEASYFDGYHFQHIADRDERDRLNRIRRDAARATRRAARQAFGEHIEGVI